MYQIKQKEKNKKNFLNYLYSQKIITISEVASDLSLTYPTAKTIVNYFLKENLLIQIANQSNSVGRSSSSFSINDSYFFSIGIQIEVNLIKFILIDIYGKIIKEKALQNIFFDQLTFEKLLAEEFDIFYNSLSEKEKENLLGVGISFPGIVDNSNLNILRGINLNLSNISLREIYKKYNLIFYIENEANASLFAEKIMGKARSLENFLLISIASGIGMGVFINSKIFRGMNGMAGEVGHTSLIHDGKKCKCGNLGCWELYASEKAFENLYPTYPFNDFSHKKDSLNTIFSNYDATLKEYIKFLSLGIRNQLFSFDITNIIISGELSNYLKLYKKELEEFTSDNFFFKNIEKNFIFSEFDSNSTLIGAALIPISNYFNLIKEE